MSARVRSPLDVSSGAGGGVEPSPRARLPWPEFSMGLAHPDPGALLPSGVALAWTNPPPPTATSSGRHRDGGDLLTPETIGGDGGGGRKATRAPILMLPRKSTGHSSALQDTQKRLPRALPNSNYQPLDQQPTIANQPSGLMAVTSGASASAAVVQPHDKKRPRSVFVSPPPAPLLLQPSGGGGARSTPITLLMKLVARAPIWVVVLDYTAGKGGPSTPLCHQSMHSSKEVVGLMRSGQLQV